MRGSVLCQPGRRLVADAPATVCSYRERRASLKSRKLLQTSPKVRWETFESHVSSPVVGDKKSFNYEILFKCLSGGRGRPAGGRLVGGAADDHRASPQFAPSAARTLRGERRDGTDGPGARLEHRGRKVGRRRWEGGKERRTMGAWESTREGAEEERKSQSVEGEDGGGLQDEAGPL